MELAAYWRRLATAEELLARAARLAAKRHDGDRALRDTAIAVAEAAESSHALLDPGYDTTWREEELSNDARRLRSALMHGSRAGKDGRVRDLLDVLTLAHEVMTTRQVVKEASATVDPVAARRCEARIVELDAALAARQMHGVTTMPDRVWTPIAAAILLVAVGILGWAAGMAWLAPSIGPTVYLQTARPNRPAARFYHVAVGHYVGLLSGLLALAILGAWHAPPIHDGTLPLSRLFAAALAALVALAATQALKASHPPAAATTLLVTLGFVRTGSQVLALAIGLGVVAVLGEGLRRARRRAAPAQAATRRRPGRTTGSV